MVEFCFSEIKSCVMFSIHALADGFSRLQGNQLLSSSQLV